MKCPYCNNNLKPVSVSGKYGQSIILDQCENCGGIWFDEWELFAPDANEIKKLEKLDEKKLAQKNPEPSGYNNCPKCNIELNVLKDPLIPKQIEMNKCSQCDGFWMNRGEASEYKNYQEKKKAKFSKKEGKEFEKSVKQFLELHKEKNDTLAMVGKTLSSPINPYSFGQIDNPEQLQAEKIANIAMTILQILFRLLVR